MRRLTMLRLVGLFLVLQMVAPSLAVQAAGGQPTAAPRAAPAAAASGAGHAATTPVAKGGRPAVLGGQHRREVVARRTRTSRTFVDDQGRYTTQFFPGSINYQDSAGRWQPIDGTLTADTVPGFAVTNKANRYQVHLPASLGVGPVRVGTGAGWVEFALVGAAGSKASVTADTATYAGALSGVDVAYEAGNDQLQETLTLRSAAAAHSFTYTLKTSDGLSAKANALGGIDFVDAAGKVQLTFLPPVMQDSSQRPSGVSHAVTLALGSGATGQTVTLAADPAWLASPDRQWPVTIDPSTGFGGILYSGTNAGCQISDGSQANTNLCNQGPQTNSVGYNGAVHSRALFAWDLSGGVPSNVTIVQANLNLYLTGKTVSGTSLPIEAHQVTQSWTTGTTWNTRDGTTAWTTAGGSYAAAPTWTAAVGPTTGQWYSWFFTAVGQGWANGAMANYGVELKAANEGTVDSASFASATYANSAYWPQLEVDWQPFPGDQPWYTLDSYPLTDRLGLEVNVANGNLILNQRDLTIAGTGMPLVLDRAFNDLAVFTGTAGNSWVFRAGGDIVLYSNGNASGNGDGLYVGGDGGLFFPQNADRSYRSPPGLDATLAQNQDSSYSLTFHASGLQYRWAAPTWALASIADRNGNSISFSYDPNTGNETSVTDTQGRMVSFDHNSPYGSRLISAMHDPSGRSWQYQYNSSGNLTQYTDPAGKLTVYTYDANNQVTQIQDPNGNLTKLTYDASFRVTSITLGLSSAVQATYGYTYNAGNTVMTDPNNHQTTYFADNEGRVTKATDALGNSQQWAWTADNHVQQYTDAKGKITIYSYDGNNNLTKVQLPTGAATSWAYQDSAHPYYPTGATDPQGNTVSYHYTAAGNVDTVTNQLPSQNQTQLAYNANGTVDHVVDARGNTTGYAYDSVGNLRTITPPSPMGPTNLWPDALSRTIEMTDGNGVQSDYLYDPLDRPTSLTYPSYYQANVAHAYDNDGSVTSMTDNTGTTGYQYDARNRQTQKTLPASLGGGSFSYGYDGASNLTGFTDTASVPGQTLSVTYGYNPADLVTSLVESGKTTGFGYDPNHRRTSTTYPDGVVMSQGYDDSGRLTSIVGMSGATTLSSFAYSYARGSADTMLPQSYTETLASPGGPASQVYGAMAYDQLNRQTKWRVIKQSDLSVVHAYTYQYDGNGNRTQIVADPKALVGGQLKVVDPTDPSTPPLANSNESDLSFTAPNEIGQIVAFGDYGSTNGHGSAATGYSYDQAGNQTGNDGGGTGKPLSIAYLPSNQTQSVSDVNQNAEAMTWAGAGQAQRVKRAWTDQGTNYTATYAWSLLGLSGYSNTGIAEPTTTLSVTSWLIRDPAGAPVAQRYSDGTEYYYLFDGQGDVVGLEDPGTMRGAYDYCPTGNEADLSSAVLTNVALANPLHQGAAPYDDLTKLYVWPDGTVTEDYNGTGTSVAYRYGPRSSACFDTGEGCVGGGGELGDGTLTFYRGTTAYDALETVQNGAFDLGRIASRGGVYITSQFKTAEEFALAKGAFGRDGGAGVIGIEVAASDLSALAERYGIAVETPMLAPIVEGATETLIPFAALEDFYEIAHFFVAALPE